MPELKKFYVNSYGSGSDENGTLVTPDYLRSLGNNKIMLIKTLRVVSGMGLKDSKDGVEKNCMDGYNAELSQWGTINPEKTVAYFSQFIGPFPTAEELKVEEENKTGKTMFEACALAYANYKLLGYHNPFQAVRDVVSRYEDNCVNNR